MSHTGRSHVKETYACMYLQNLAKTKIGEKHNRSSRALLSMYTFLLYVSFHTRRALFISMQPDEDADQRSASGAAAPPQVVEFRARSGGDGDVYVSFICLFSYV